MLRRVEEWQARKRAEERAAQKAELARAMVCWGRSVIGEFRKPAGPGQCWTIRELLSSDELAAEGRAMSHCVATYTARCVRRTSTIWSVGIEAAGGRERCVTVEVNPESRQVVQAKARCNDAPDEASLAILRLWADRESLKIEV